MIKRTLRGFKVLKKKYYTPKVKRSLKNVGKAFKGFDNGSNSLLGDKDVFGTTGAFDNWNYSQKQHKSHRRLRKKKKGKKSRYYDSSGNIHLGHDVRPSKGDIFSGSDYWN